MVWRCIHRYRSRYFVKESKTRQITERDRKKLVVIARRCMVGSCLAYYPLKQGVLPHCSNDLCPGNDQSLLPQKMCNSCEEMYVCSMYACVLQIEVKMLRIIISDVCMYVCMYVCKLYVHIHIKQFVGNKCNR